MTRAEVFTLAGPAGALETKLEFADERRRRPRVFGVACHPHPLYGGAMDNKVTHTLARAMNECGAPAFRFNFRGVGASGGAFDNGRGETDDLVAVVAEGRRRFPAARAVVRRFLVRRVRGVARRADASRPTSSWRWRHRWRASSWASVAHPDCDWMLAQGDADDVVPPDAVLALGGGAAAEAAPARAGGRRPFLSRASCTSSSH